MKYNAEPIKNWFGFTRRERRSTFSLLIIIVVILVIRYSIPDSNSKVEDLTSTVPELNNQPTNDNSSKPVQVKGKRSYLKKTTGNQNKNFSAVYTSYQSVNRKLKKPVDINLSDTSELIKLPGIGSVLSARIIKYRIYLGGYSKIEQLKEVYGLSEETYEMIKKDVVADSAFITRLNINSADYKGLSHVRYLDKYEIAAILKYRKLKGNILKLSDMVDNKLITSEKAKKVRAYIRFE